MAVIQLMAPPASVSKAGEVALRDALNVLPKLRSDEIVKTQPGRPFLHPG